MGTWRRQKISDEEICRRYQAGEGRVAIGLRAGLWDQEVVAVLQRHGVTLRTMKEAAVLAGEQRKARGIKKKARLE